MPSLLRRAAQRRPLAVFSCLAVGLGWLVALPMVLSPAGLGLVPIQLPEIWLILVACTPTAEVLEVDRIGIVCGQHTRPVTTEAARPS